MNNQISYEIFERIYATIRETLKSSSYLFQLNDDMEMIPDRLYVQIIKLHNAAVDFKEAYEIYIKEEKDGLQENKETE